MLCLAAETQAWLLSGFLLLDVLDCCRQHEQPFVSVPEICCPVLLLILKTTHHSSSFFLMSITEWQDLTSLKHLGFFDFPITNMGSFSPTALAAAIPVRRTLLCLPPMQLSDLIEPTVLIEQSKLICIINIFKFVL